MATSTPPSLPNTALPIETQRKILSITSLSILIIGPIVIALPPRKLDFYTVFLIGGTAWGGNEVCRNYTGRSIVQRAKDRATKMTGTGLSEKAQMVQQRLREEKASKFQGGLGGASTVTGESKVLQEVERIRTSSMDEKEKQRELEKVKGGGETKTWKQKRDEREREYLENGKGYSDLIMDQIWEVWNWGQEKTEEIKEKDEKVVAEKKHESGKNDRK